MKNNDTQSHDSECKTNNQKPTTRSQKAFTLVELLLVITIISVLAAVVVPRFFGRSKDAYIAATQSTISNALGVAIDMFEQDNGRYPTEEEGLSALVANPQLPNWRGPYIKAATVPQDAWKQDFQYTYPSKLTGSESLYDIVSAGPDSNFGTDDDISNHATTNTNNQ